MSDDSLNVAPLAARLLGVGVILLDDAGQVVAADAEAYRLLGAAHAHALKPRWDSLRQRLEMAGPLAATDESNSERRVHASTASGEPALRLEVHRFARNRRLVLIRDKASIDDQDHIGLLASEALANRHVLSGLVHEAKGPLNNFYLRLALLQSLLARTGSVEEANARGIKHVETLQQEAQTLLECLEEIGKLAHPEDDAREEFDLNETLENLARLLRHAATIHEATFQVSLPNATTIVHANAREVSLAVMSLAMCMIDSLHPNAQIAIALSRDDDALRIVLNASPATLPAQLADAMFNVRATDTRFVAQTTARIVIEAHGGDVRIVSDHADRWGFVVNMPVSRTST